jgi:hypothetical protein
MTRAIRLIVIFVVLLGLFAVTLEFVLPALLEYYLANCTTTNSALCSVSAGFLSFWWLALIPTLIVATALVAASLERRRTP